MNSAKPVDPVALATPVVILLFKMLLCNQLVGMGRKENKVGAGIAPTSCVQTVGKIQASFCNPTICSTSRRTHTFHRSTES